MDTFFIAAISPITLVVVSLVGWFSRRATRESRLLMKIQRFGSAYAAVPESPEKELLKTHFLEKVKELNNELDERPKRALVNFVTVTTTVIGIVIAVTLAPVVSSWWGSLILGLVLGSVIGAVNLVATWFIDRRTSKRAFESKVRRFISGEAL